MWLFSKNSDLQDEYPVEEVPVALSLSLGSMASTSNPTSDAPTTPTIPTKTRARTPPRVRLQAVAHSTNHIHPRLEKEG